MDKKEMNELVGGDIELFMIWLHVNHNHIIQEFKLIKETIEDK